MTLYADGLQAFLLVVNESNYFKNSTFSQVITSLKHKLHSMERMVKSKDSELRYFHLFHLI